MVKRSFNEFGHRELWKGEALVKADCLPLEPSCLLMVPEKLLLQEQRCVVLQLYLPFVPSQKGFCTRYSWGRKEPLYSRICETTRE